MKNHHNAGMTLMETVIAAVMVGVVGLTFFGVYTTAHRFMLQSTIFSSSNSEATYAIEHIKRRIIRANLVSVYADGSIGFRYDHRTFRNGPPPTPNNLNDDQWDCYGLAGTTLRYNQSFATGADPGGSNFAGPRVEVIAQNIQPPGGAIPPLFQIQNGGTIVIISLTARQATGQQVKDTTVATRISPRGVAVVGP